MHSHRLLFCKAYAVLCDFLRQSSLRIYLAKPLQRGGQWRLGVAWLGCLSPMSARCRLGWASAAHAGTAYPTKMFSTVASPFGVRRRRAWHVACITLPAPAVLMGEPALLKPEMLLNVRELRPD
ncbi:hypothetical protein BJI49_10495 [Acetobacter pasteurianus]|nr:hypothetical protein BJI49_10495 [Acetobacter pasteurianus]